MTHRRAFTLIELLLVLTVILILTALGLGHYGQAMRKSAVQGSADQILRACDTARQLSLQGAGDPDLFYGVRIDATSDGDTSVTVVQQVNGRTGAVAGPDGGSLLDYDFPTAAAVWEGDTDLGNGSGSLEWYFMPGSGEVVELAAGRVVARYVGVGTRPVTTGSMWGLATNAGTSRVIAPSTASAPGLSVRSPDNRYRIAIGVYPSGLAYTTVYDQYEGN
jgi:prepilin-type N-terminal cleavage/methylation domain-containing protein